VNLDPIVQERVKDFFRDYHGDGKTLFLSTHFVEVAADVCDRVAVISDGRLEARLGPDELSHQRLLDLFADRFETAPASPATPAGVAETAAGSDDGAGSADGAGASAATEE
jgi:ABC-2 type transport system ATP-binding protein